MLEVEKAKRTRRTSGSSKTEVHKDAAPLPSDLTNILWSPDDHDLSTSSSLPEGALFDDALNNLLITLQPQTQHRAVYPTSSGPPIEPTLAIYCPIEGGDYIIDETVHELARSSGSDVITLDAAQLAAGEWGTFGKGV